MRSIPQSRPALVWLSTAVGPHARTAAIHIPSLLSARMANSENPTMNTVETASAQTPLPPALAEAGPRQLLDRNHAVLVGREPGDRAVGTPIATFLHPRRCVK